MKAGTWVSQATQNKAAEEESLAATHDISAGVAVARIRSISCLPVCFVFSVFFV